MESLPVINKPIKTWSDVCVVLSKKLTPLMEKISAFAGLTLQHNVAILTSLGLLNCYIGSIHFVKNKSIFIKGLFLGLNIGLTILAYKIFQIYSTVVLFASMPYLSIALQGVLLLLFIYQCKKLLSSDKSDKKEQKAQESLEPKSSCSPSTDVLSTNPSPLPPSTSSSVVGNVAGLSLSSTRSFPHYGLGNPLNRNLNVRLSIPTLLHTLTHPQPPPERLT